MKEKIEEISLSMERGHRRVLRVLGALLAVGLFVLLWKWRGLTAMQPLVDGGMGRWTRAVLESIVITLAAQWVLCLLPWPLLALFGRRTIVPLTAPVAGFVVFFLYKALSFSSVLHTVLCSILYLAVLVFFLLTALGVLRTRIFLLLLAGLPLLVHIIMDFSDYEGFFLFLPELSVLLLMASLLCLALRLRPAGKGAKPWRNRST